MSAAAIRIIAGAATLAAGLLFAGPASAIAHADPDDLGGGADAESTTMSAVDAATGDGGDLEEASDSEPAEPSAPDRPTSTVGNGRIDVVGPDENPTGGDRPAGYVKPPRKFTPTMRIPVLRIPSTEELWAPGLTPPSAFVRTLELPVLPTLQDVLRALAQPEPEPPRPGPAFRTQQEEAPVIDTTGNTTGGGGGAAAEAPPVIRAPVVVAPRPQAPVVGAQPGRSPAPASPPAAAPGASPAVAGVPTPSMRGSLPPSGTTPMTRPGTETGQTPAGYPRFLRGSSIGELVVVALPGLGGLLFLTFSGGVIGYRQADSGRYVRTAAVARFLP